MGKARSGITKDCACCGKEFYVPKYRAETARFCSLECQNHGQYSNNRVQFQCEKCKITYWDSPSRKSRKFCSVECRVADAKDERAARNDIRRLVRARRGAKNNRNARILAFAHHGTKCLVCKIEEQDFCLEIHHIDENPVNNDVSNLAVLCAFCHRKVHKKYLTLLGERNAA